MSAARISPEKTFAFVASLLTAIYLLIANPLTDYYHGVERFLHVVDYGMSFTGHAGEMPIGYLELVKISSPGALKKAYNQQTKNWETPLKKRSEKNLKHKKLQETQTERFLRASNIVDPYSQNLPFSTLRNPSMYSIVGYFPFIIPTIIGILTEMQPVFVLYAGIICNAALTIILGYYAIRITPILKWFHVFLLLIPSVCFTRILVMHDALTLSLAVLIIARIMQLKSHPRPITTRIVCEFIIASILIGLIKNIYFLMPCAALLIPSACFKNTRTKLLLVGVATICSITLALAWSMHALPQTNIMSSSVVKGAHTPVNFFIDMISLPFSHRGILYWLNHIFFWNRTRPPIFDLPINITIILMAAAHLLMLIRFPYGDSIKLKISLRERLLCGALFIITAFLIIAAVGLQTRAPAAQGRYFLPILPLLSMMIYPYCHTSNAYSRHIVYICACFWLIIHYYMLSYF